MVELVVPKKYKKLVMNNDSTLKEVPFTVSGRKIPLTEIRKRELDRFEKLGTVQEHTNEEYGQISDDQITERLKVLGGIENNSGNTPGQRREGLIKFERTRHLMIWGGWFNNFKSWPPSLFCPVCLQSSILLLTCTNESQRV